MAGPQLSSSRWRTEWCPARMTAIGEKADKSWHVRQEALQVMLKDA